MKKAIAIVKEHPDLQGSIDEINALQKSINERLGFLNRQAKKIKEDAEATEKEILKRLEALVASKGLLPENYVRDKMVLQVDEACGLLFAADIEDFRRDGAPPELMKVIRRLFE